MKTQLRDLGERLDAHRKRQQALHPHLTLTGIYNVLEKLRRDEALDAKEKKIHDDGLVTLLRQIHDEIDAAVLAAYGWDDLRRADTPVRLVDGKDAQDRGTGVSRLLTEAFEAELLTRLVALNHERAAEEQRGLIRWLRPDYQNPAAIPGRDGSPSRPPVEEQTEIELEEIANTETKDKRRDAGRPSAASTLLPWPETLPERWPRRTEPVP